VSGGPAQCVSERKGVLYRAPPLPVTTHILGVYLICPYFPTATPGYVNPKSKTIGIDAAYFLHAGSPACQPNDSVNALNDD